MVKCFKLYNHFLTSSSQCFTVFKVLSHSWFSLGFFLTELWGIQGKYFINKETNKQRQTIQIRKQKLRGLQSIMVQFSSVAQSCPTLCDPMDCRMPGLPVHHQLPEFTQTHVHQVDDAIQPSHPLSSPSPPAFNLSQHQGLFKWVSSSYQVAKVLEFQLQHQSFQWTFRTDLL